jgi:ABC-2 type transport system permease protein
MIPVLRSEWGKLCSLRSPWICLIAAMLLVPATAFTLANDFVYDIEQGRLSAGTTRPSLDFLGSSLQFGLAMFIAFTMLPITSEYATGSIRSTLLAEPRRLRVLLSKSIVVSAIAAATGGLVGMGSYELVDSILGNHASEGTSAVVVLARSGVLVGLASIFVCGVAALVRSSVGTLATSFGILVGMLAIPAPLGTWLPAQAGADWLSGVAVGRSLGVLVAWGAVSWIAGWYALERRDA